MESEQPQPTTEEIYSCIKCHYPLSSSLSVKATKNNWEFILENMKDMINSMLKNSNQSSNTINESNISNSENTNPNSSGIDIETLLKIQKIMKSMKLSPASFLPL